MQFCQEHPDVSADHIFFDMRTCGESVQLGVQMHLRMQVVTHFSTYILQFSSQVGKFERKHIYHMLNMRERWFSICLNIIVLSVLSVTLPPPDMGDILLSYFQVCVRPLIQFKAAALDFKEKTFWVYIN